MEPFPSYLLFCLDGYDSKRRVGGGGGGGGGGRRRRLRINQSTGIGLGGEEDEATEV